MKETIVACILAGLLWLVMFSPWTAGRIPFWPAMTLAAGILAAWAVLRDRPAFGAMLSFRSGHVTVGVVSAVVLYSVFFVGHRLAGAVADRAIEQVRRIYLLREAVPLWKITLFLLLIAPAEELFWRGFVQRRIAERYGKWQGYFAATVLYAVVHVWAFNPMLTAAALLCGLAWGWVFLRSGSLWSGLVSHIIWDVTIFVVFPIRC